MPGSAPLVVTTRSRLRSRARTPSMHAARRRILRELATTDGARHSISLVSQPREFWSVSVWETRHTMQEFVRSGAHGTYLWEVGRWLESFWLMRWRPTGRELGTWVGTRLAPAAPDGPPDGPPEAPQGLDPAIRDQVLAAIPTLAAAYGPSGAPTYDSAPEVRWDRELVAGATGLLVRLPPGRRGRRTVRTLADRLRADDEALLRVVTGRAQHRAGTFLLGLWAGHEGAARTVDGLARHGDEGLWACELAPEHEFGRWDDLRVRDLGLLGRLDPGGRSTSADRPYDAGPGSADGGQDGM